MQSVHAVGSVGFARCVKGLAEWQQSRLGRLVEAINKDLNLLNASIEKKLMKKKSLYLSFAGYNILNQNFSINRQVNGNSILDTRALQLSRYFLFTLTYRWNKFGK